MDAMGQNASGALVFTSAPLYLFVLHSYVTVLHHITPLSYMRNDRLTQDQILMGMKLR